MQITCPRCYRAVPVTALHMQQMVGKCTDCEHVFSFRNQIINLLGEPQPHEELIAVPRPAKLTATSDGLGLTLRWHWFRPYVFFLIPMAIFWNGVVFTFVSALSPWPLFFTGDAADLIAAFLCTVPLLALPHLWVGLWLIYYSICLLVNQTTIHVNQGEVTVRHSPLPWRGNKTVMTDQITQLYTKEQRAWQRNREATYEVRYIDRANQHGKLLSGLASSEHALYVEQEIERFLGIVDRPVRGAYR